MNAHRSDLNLWENEGTMRLRVFNLRREEQSAQRGRAQHERRTVCAEGWEPSMREVYTLRRGCIQHERGIPWWVYLGVYLGGDTMVGVPRVYRGWCIAGYASLYPRWCICLLTVLPYPPPWYMPPIPPWVYLPPYRTWCSTGSSGLGVALPAEGALGSNLGLIRENRRKEASLSPKVWGKSEASAQSYSHLPGINIGKIG